MDDIPNASHEFTESIRQLLEDRKLGDYTITDFGTRGIPKDIFEAIANLSPHEREFFLQHEALHRAALERAQRDSDGYKLYMNHNATQFLDDYFAVLPDKPKAQPTWQDRRNQSKEAKEALIAKLKGKRK